MTEKILTGNKGEWSEIYTFFKLLGDGVLYSGDENLKKISDLFYPILKILRQESIGGFEYSIDRNSDIVIVNGGDKELRIPCEVFREKVPLLHKEIKENNGSFALPAIQNFMESIHRYSIKAKSDDKTDIRIVIHDLRTNLQPTLGFSIKSEVGASSTIFNTNGDKTNFLYRIDGITSADAETINKNKYFKKKFQQLDKLNAQVEFVGVVGKILSNNLIYVDSSLPEILGRMLFLFFSTSLSKIKDITEQLKAENPLSFDYSDNQDFYEHKIKRILTECTLGLKGTTVWHGEYEATGGYLIVKEDGDLVCYHIYDRNQFENYLFANTKFDTPSTSRHNYGNIYEENGEFFIKLNLQIRFI